MKVWGNDGPIFESLPTGGDIAHWFVEEMRGEPNVGGDAWWLCREPHSGCRLLAYVDYDVQEFRLLEINTNDSTDLLWVSNGLDGLSFMWQNKPKPSIEVGVDWRRDGIEWMADQIVLHYEAHPPSIGQRGGEKEVGCDG